MDKSNENIRNIQIYNQLVEKASYRWDDYSSVLDYLVDRLDNYKNHIMALDGYVQSKVLENKEILVGLNPKIIDVMIQYLKGKIPAAYDSMKEAFEFIENILIRKSKKSEEESILREKFVFKARELRDGEQPLQSRSDMFHIPFDKRHLVASQRFSISGVPSIYLGESIYDCYEELLKPNLENFWVSLFHFSPSSDSSKGIKLVDLTFANQKHLFPILWNQEKKNDEAYVAAVDELVNDILLYPLIMACSIVCKFPNASFKQEYVVPQMLYQLCSVSNSFNGVKFYSTKLDGMNRKKMQNVMINYALPAQNIRAVGHCPILTSWLSLTDPISAEICGDIKIKADPALGRTTMGLPIISMKCAELKDDKTVLALDKMTMYFEKILAEKDLKALRPLCGWKTI